MKQILKSKKVRVTDFRLAVLEIFNRHQNAIAMEQIESELNDFDRITLYRTIKTFKEKGIIHEIVMPDNLKKLALCAEECMEEDHHHHHDHVHFQCTSCSEVYCVDVPNFPQLGLKGFSVERMEIQAFGTCQSCR